jgi:hypothetical protein
MPHFRSAVVCLFAAVLMPLSAVAQKHITYQVGPQPDGSFVTPTNQVVSPAGMQVAFNGRPVAVAVRPDQKTAAVLVFRNFAYRGLTGDLGPENARRGRGPVG